MKKSFFQSVILSASLMLLSGNVFAQATNSDRLSSVPTVTIGGFVNASAAYRTQESVYEKDRLPDASLATAGQPDTAINTTGTHNKMTNNPDFTNEAEIHIKVAGINELGMKYGAIVELEANTTTAARNEGLNADKAYIFTESQIGKVEFGNNSAVNRKMKVGPETFARGAGGINGKYLEYINLPMLMNSSQLTNGTIYGNVNLVQTYDCFGGFGPNGGFVAPDGTVGTDVAHGSDCSLIKLPRFILIPQSPIAHGGYAKGFYNRETDNDYSSGSGNANFGFNKNRDSQIRDGQFGDLEDASKINYYTPRIAGFQFGTTFTPDTGNNGTSASITGDNSGDIKQAISYGVNYSNTFGGLGIALSATGETGKYEQSRSATIQRNDLQAYDIGAMATFFGITIGGSYGNWGKSLQPKTGIYSCDYNPSKFYGNQDCAGQNEKKFDDATYYTAGLGYEFGPFATSLTYLSSDFQENKYKALSLGADYKMAKGLMPYVEVTKYEFISNQPSPASLPGYTIYGSFPDSQRQLRNNSGYVVLAGLLFSF